MPIFTSKDKDKNRSVNFMAVDGLPEYQLGDAINATIVKNENVLRIKARVFKRPIINLPINKILSAVFASETEILEKDKSVIGLRSGWDSSSWSFGNYRRRYVRDRRKAQARNKELFVVLLRWRR